MKIAVEGCCLGELDQIYEKLERIENSNKYKIDFRLICGDFQALRNKADLQCMAVPKKYQHLQEMKTFYKWVFTQINIQHHQHHTQQSVFTDSCSYKFLNLFIITKLHLITFISKLLYQWRIQKI
ncbi:hypothetical protein ACJMK2_013924 [Sinanodonta woodiana]|uniref:Uncharacterized protein n=1 Tax=Sinanodonta woodiana TaxID=1069815 RepID=A0ABD3V2A8_SINWO